MADEVQNILIKFDVDDSELITAQERLGKSGKIDTAAFNNIKSAISSTASDTQGLIKEFKTVANTATKMGKSVEAAFEAGVTEALNDAGVSVKEFSAALTKANQPVKSLREQLKILREQIAQAKVDGKDFGVEFEALTKKAGKLSDAISDAGAEIKNAGSDTRGIDNVVGSITALAGGYAAVQGAAALFGEENEDVQKALLKVNGAMALAQGLQTVYNATLKEGAVTKLVDSVRTGAQSAALTLYTFVTGGATVATKALRAALIATGIGAIVVLVVSLVSAFSDMKDAESDAADEAERLTKQLEDLDKVMRGSQSFINRQIEIIKNEEKIKDLRAAGGNQDKAINAIRRRNLDLEIQGLQVELATKRELLSVDDELNIKGQIYTKQQEKLRIAIEEQADASARAKENAEKERAARLAALKDTLARLEIDLLASEKGSSIELELKKKIVKQKSLIELAGAKLTENQILLIKAQSFADQLELQKQYNARLTNEQLQAQIDTNAVLLAGITINNEERLRLTIENLEATAQLEINAAEGNASKILLIEAKKLSDIRALKNADIDKEAQDQIKSNERIKETLNSLANDIKQHYNDRRIAAKAVGDQELRDVDVLIQANERKQQSQEDYNKAYADLAQQRADIEEKTSKRIRDIDDEETAAKLENLKAIASEVINIASQVADFFASLGELSTERDRQNIENQKRQLQSLVDANAITAKQAKIRAQEIEIAERRAKQRQAQREKQQATFRALLAIPQAFLKGLTDGGIYLAAIYAALAAAEAAVVIARPVPKFFRGKKDSYQGPGVVGDMGSELVERNGRMFLYTKPTETYLGAKDKVYTAAETRQIMHNTNINTTLAQPVAEGIDYGRLAKAMPKSSVAINIEKDFISEAVADGLSKNNYFNNRYQFSK